MTLNLEGRGMVGPFPHIPARTCPGPFGTPAAIAPHFDALPMPEQQAAIALMLETGRTMACVAAALGREVSEILLISRLRLDPMRPASAVDSTVNRARAGLLARPVSQAAGERALDEVLVVMDAYRDHAGADRDGAFELTLEELCHAIGMSLDTARRRVHELENRDWISRVFRSGRAPLVTIEPAGLSRLEAVAMRGRS